MRIRTLWLASTLGCSAGESTALEGMYRVTSLVTSAPCGDDQPVADPPPYLKFTKGNFFGETYYSYASCTDSAGTSCSELGGLVGGFTEPRDDGWGGYVASASSAGDRCRLDYRQQAAVLDRATMSKLTVESSEHGEEETLAPTECTTGLAQQRGSGMRCLVHEIWSATAL